MPIKATRALLDAALSGALKHQPMRTDPLFGFQVPTALPGVEPAILNPRETWADKAAYDAQARALVDMFNKNFAKFEVHVDADVKAAAPCAAAGGGVGSSCPRRVEDAPPARRRAPTIAHRACSDSSRGPAFCAGMTSPLRAVMDAAVEQAAGGAVDGSVLGVGLAASWPGRSWHRRR